MVSDNKRMEVDDDNYFQPPKQTWRNDQENAGKQFGRMIDELRLAIPRIIEPFQRPPNVAMFKQYAQGVQGAQNNIKTLREQWKSPDVQVVFEHTRKSLAAGSDLSPSKSEPAHGWVEREKRDGNTTATDHSEKSEDDVIFPTEEEKLQLVASFQMANPGIKLVTHDDGRTISVQ
ncbi:hypothetical protein ACEQ8H_006369 [Pleosporales sp. CAS-2024a]